LLVAILSLASCAPAASPEIAFDPASLLFSGERALEIETEFVTTFPNRDSGQPNNRLAAEWLVETVGGLGLDCALDEWSFVNYSRQIPLHNAVCVLPGESEKEVVLTAHHDQAPTTVYGADNDGSGVAILVHLAEVFAAEAPPRYSLVLLFADAEEFGNAGTRRYLDPHPDPQRILAALSIDNVGKRWYLGLDMDPRGWFRGYGALWLQHAAQESARAAGDLWVPVIRPAPFQALEQAVPIAFMDEGPFVARGIPSFGFAGICDPEVSQTCYDTYHTPDDTIDTQSSESLRQAGRVTEALVRQLQLMESFPEESGPYLYFESESSVLRGLPLTLGFLLPVAGFLFAARKTAPSDRLAAWRRALPHYLSLFLPLLLSVGLLYALVALGLLQKFDAYFATTKDPAWTSPRWPAIAVWLLGLALLLIAGRRLAREAEPPSHDASRSLAFLAIGLAALFVAATNPFTLLFTVPCFSWLLIRGRRGFGFALDLLSFALGGLLVYVLIYFFGFVILRIGLNVLWYLMMMFAIPMISPLGAAAIAAILAAGLSLVVRPVGATPRAS
jgi:hypothetical protein